VNPQDLLLSNSGSSCPGRPLYLQSPVSSWSDQHDGLHQISDYRDVLLEPTDSDSRNYLNVGSLLSLEQNYYLEPNNELPSDFNSGLDFGLSQGTGAYPQYINLEAELPNTPNTPLSVTNTPPSLTGSLDSFTSSSTSTPESSTSLDTCLNFISCQFSPCTRVFAHRHEYKLVPPTLLALFVGHQTKYFAAAM